ncbi:MAG: hypothetical protein JWQ81_7840 [Amycolatopsis sp.]|jgi:anti-sigma B factor antagonist|uniref:STAS domain-containing protein n=1 Tax=Amycolatopsis sp. TaxID=37632 RepID=UPI0026070097|nr:STAS domain-containing protein [Amycolatopsis sp.]MCU1687101.1 hypothetical protein [Amycolatopsis sp.]
MRDGVGRSPFTSSHSVEFLVESPRVVVVTLVGEIDLASVGELEKQFVRAWEPAPPAVVVVDTAAVEFFSSPGLNVLLDVRRRADIDGTEFRVTVESSFVRRVLEVTGMDEYLAVYPSRADALADIDLD